ncbi:protogenin-like [Anthonomus grandis grandis]|uniref:protogenin-like n=1 Tax=Anthonomus grandis grandis TaxID=2921223 RepID=UPI0021661C6A|nr:protogenin-like [Anthonomus grandis grandis]
MATRTLQLCLVFAVGFYRGPVPASAGSNRAVPIEPATNQANTRPNVTLWFSEEPSDVIVTRGQDAILRCVAESTTGNVTIVWLHENSPVSPEDQRWLIRGSVLKVLTVNGGKRGSLGKFNTGEYSCLAKNSYGAILSRVARVRVASIDKEITIKGDDTVLQSQPLYLQCNIHSIPLAEIHWEFNNLPLTNDKRYVPLPHGALLLRNTNLDDSGNYRCVATNSILEKNKTKDFHVNVLVPGQAAMTPSIIIANTSNSRLLVEGDSIEFICIATGWPLPTVKWINSKNASISNSSSSSISYLTFKNADINDSDNYTCVASNGIERVSETVNVQVYQRPFFNVTPVSVVSPSARTVRMDCQAVGVPQPKITWLKDGHPLKPEVRIRKQATGIVFTHTLSTDTGVYQCVAANPVGKVWSTAQIEINNSQSPSPPENVQCRPYDEDKICLTWKNPANATVKAYSIYSSYINSEGLDVLGEEYLIPVDPTKKPPIADNPHKMVEGLHPNTNYTFFVRLYTNKASDYAKKVTCQPGLKGSRNLEIETINKTALALKWSEISSDILCNGTRDPYVVQWYLDGSSEHVFTYVTSQRNFSLFGLLPGNDYCINVVTQNNPKGELCTLYTMPSLHSEENDTMDVSEELRAPQYLLEDSTNSTSTKITWDRIPGAKFYSLCYTEVGADRRCEQGDFFKSYSTKFTVTKLKPDTEYVFRVRAHDSSNAPGILSDELRVRTRGDVPSPVTNLKYLGLNSTTVCIYWRPPLIKNGKLKNYLVSYTTDKNWSLEGLVDVNISASEQTSSDSCKGDENDDVLSMVLTNLSSDHTYLVMVRAENAVGLGKPSPPIFVRILDVSGGADEMNGSDMVASNQRFGIILGVLISICCIMCCVALILLRRRCMKRRASARDRMDAASNYCPAVARYTTHLGTVQVRAEQPCSLNEHEVEHLVPEEHTSHIPPVTVDHLDTKGASNLPNGYMNGSHKHHGANGHALTGHVHITENPQFYAIECNGNNLSKNKSEPLLRRYEEDSNSNLKTSRFQEFYKLFDAKKFNNKGSPYASPCSKSKDASLNTTQITFLDDSATSRRLSPLLEPNG